MPKRCIIHKIIETNEEPCYYCEQEKLLEIEQNRREENTNDW